jgi:hypothetical protein
VSIGHAIDSIGQILVLIGQIKVCGHNNVIGHAILVTIGHTTKEIGAPPLI